MKPAPKPAPAPVPVIGVSNEGAPLPVAPAGMTPAVPARPAPAPAKPPAPVQASPPDLSRHPSLAGKEAAQDWLARERKYRFHRVYDAKLAASKQGKRVSGSMYPEHIANRENAKRWKHLGVTNEAQALEIKTRCEKLLSSDAPSRS